MACARFFPVKRERPILFSAPMVRAILDGRKTQTRRVARPRFDDRKPCEHWKGENHEGDATMYRHCAHGSEGFGCPYGSPGDRLWVRETWMQTDGTTSVPDVFYRASETAANAEQLAPWRPSIFMPRGASRITLEIVAVRVERLQDITEEDARAEGLLAMERAPLDPGSKKCIGCGRHRDEHIGSVRVCPQSYGAIFSNWSYAGGFRHLWNSINAKRGFGWDTNPWVWVIEFKRVNT